VKRSLLEGFLSIFGARMVRTVVAIVSLPLIVRALGPGSYGDYTFLISTFSLSMIFVSAGVTEGAQKFAAENRGDGWEGAVVGYYVRIAAVLALAGATAFVLATRTGVVERFLGSEFTLYFYLLAGFVLLGQFRTLARRLLMAFGMERYSEPLHVGKKLLWAGVGLALVWQGYGVAGMLAGNLVASAFVAVVGFALVFRRVSLRSVLEPIPDDFPRSKLRSFNALNIVLVLLTMSLYHVDIIMLRTLVGNDATGYYKAALAIAEYVWLVPVVLESLLLHSTSELWSDGARERIDDLAARITRYTVALTLVLVVGIAALAGRFVPLYYGSAFTPAASALLWLLPGTLGFAAARPIMAIGRAKGNLKPLILATGAAATINVVLNAVLITRFGMLGAAAATSVGYGSMLVFHGVTARRIGFAPFGDFRPVGLAVTTAATAAAVFPLSSALSSDIVALVLVPPVGLLVHVAAALATGVLEVGDVRTAVDSLPVPLPTGS